jgi:alpha-glucuronidase
MQTEWRYRLRNHVDQQRWQEVDDRLSDQLDNARQWRDTCLDYFARFAEHP